MLNEQNQVRLISIHWGALPEWVELFLNSCALAPQIDFILFLDAELPIVGGKNVVFEKLTISDFNELASRKLFTKVNLTIPYKICDFRPAFGKIFEDYLKGYEYWGFCDSDIIFRNFWKTLELPVSKRFDIISGYEGYISGPMCIIRNTDKMNNLFTQSKEYLRVFKSENYEGFEEGFRNVEKPVLTIRRIAAFGVFLIRKGYSFRWKRFQPWNELKFQFYFYYKNRSIAVPGDFSEIVWKLKQQKKIKAWVTEFIFSDAAFQRSDNPNWVIRVTESTIKEVNSNINSPVFHFRLSKTRIDFNSCDFTSLGNRFEMQANGCRSILP